MTAYSLDDYYKILGVSETATIEDLKRAYRQKAKLLHPDKNKSPNAHQEFVLLNEAYDCLIGLKSGVVSTQSTIFYEEWVELNREETRRRAKEYAQMKYAEYQKTDEYKNTQAAATVFYHFYFLSSVVLILSPFWGIIWNGSTGFFMGLLIAFFSVQYWAGIFKEKLNLNFGVFLESILIVLKIRTFQFSVCTILNLFLFLRYTLNTQLTFFTFGLIFIVLNLLAFILCRLAPFIKSLSRLTIFITIVPTIFNLFFFINFIFSSNLASEKYSFVHEVQWYGSKRQNSGHYEKIAYIDLENNKYEEYPWFRMFYDFEAMKYKSEVTYKFADGLFGLRVLKSFEFTR